MGKGNKSAQKGGPPHLQARVSYLYQAASYFAGLPFASLLHEQKDTKEATFESAGGHEGQDKSSFSPGRAVTQIEGSVTQLARATGPQLGVSPAKHEESSTRVMLSHIRGIAKKGQIKVSPSIKHSICKRCHLLLIDGRNSTRRVENQSREGKKPWADVLVITCGCCGALKRFPVGAKRQPRRKERLGKAKGQRQSDIGKGSTRKA